MTARQGMNQWIDRYNALAVADQTLLAALSVLYEPASAVLVASCLNSAGCRESPLRAFSPQNVAVRLARLAKNGLARETARETRNGRKRFWRCRAEVGEIALRHAVRDGLFHSLAKAAQAETRGRDWLEEGADFSQRRRFRIAFHAGDWPRLPADFQELARAEPGAAGVFLAELLRLQPDMSWRQAAPDRSMAPLLAAALDDMLAGLAPPAPLDEAARLILAKNDPDPALDVLAVALADLQALRGQLAEADKTAALVMLEDSRAAAALGPAVIRGREDAADLAAAALGLRRARSGGREQLLPGVGAVFQTLAAVVSGRPADIEAMHKRLSGAAARQHPFWPALHFLRHALLFMQGQVHAARDIGGAAADRHPLTILAEGLTRLRLDPPALAADEANLRAAAAAAKKGGYRWLAAQFANLADRAGDRPAAAAPWPDLGARFVAGDEWRLSLKALADVARAEDPQAAPPNKRLAWLLGGPYPESGSPFAPFALRPIEQSQGKDGQWSRGRNVSLKRLFAESRDIPHASDQDRLLFNTVGMDFATVNSYSVDVEAALPLLVGHPHVFRDDAGGAKLEVVAGELELTAMADAGGCEIALDPGLGEFLADPDRYRPEMEPPGVAARFETPTRLRVYRLGDRERRLIRVVGAGLAVPAQGRDEALRALAGLAGSIRIHSDLPELASEEETVEADARPRFHIIPQNPGLKVELWAHPLGDDGPAYRPGRGGRILTAEVDGRTVRTRRSPGLEKELAREAVAACPALAGREDGDLVWRLDDPGDGLAFLAEAGELGDRAVPVWPRGGRFRVRRLRGMAGLSLRVNSSQEWFEIEGGLRVDENLVLDMDRLLAAVHAAPGGFIAIGEGEYLQLTEELRRQLADLDAWGERHGGAVRIPVLAASVLEELEQAGADFRADGEWRAFLERQGRLAAFSPDPPVNFRAELRDYQLEGYRWLARLAEWGAGACLADDMGLGKTVQALALLERRASLGPALVVAPTSVCHNWLAEGARFAPGLRFVTFADTRRRETAEALGARDVLVTSYSLLRQEEAVVSGVKWATAVLDEAQAIKNVATKRSRAAMALDAGFRMITTGTPIENHLGELWNLFRFINPHLLGSWRRFQDRYAAPIERHGDREAGERLRRLIRPFILRRTKTQVLDSLPPKTEITLSVELGEEERAFYESLRRGALERLAEPGEAAEKRRFQILAEIMRLRRACCAPELVAGRAGVKSAKQAEFRRIIADLVENDHKALVFSQFVDHLSIIRRQLDKMGISYQYLDGSTPARKRQAAVRDFQAGAGEVFLISLKAGGLGLNLTAADYVIHMDPWWNPAVEDQASDRAHRIGQDKPVTVYRLVAADTIEEKIVELHRNKRDLADSLLSGADQAAGLDIDEMMRLLREG